MRDLKDFYINRHHNIANMTKRIYLKVPYPEKDDAKSLGAKFDSDIKLWYLEGNSNLRKINERWAVYLDCPYSEKDEAKEKGAKFDSDLKKWYISPLSTLSDYAKWFPSKVNLTSSSTLMANSQINNHPVNITINVPAATPNPSQQLEKTIDSKLSKMQKEIKESCEYNVLELKALLKSKGVKSISTLSKQELIDRCIELKLLGTILAPPTEKITGKKRKSDGTGSSGMPLSQPAVAPSDFECPILMEVMTDPVICSDGFSYERAAIEAWLRSHSTSPKTNESLQSRSLIPNKTLKAAIITWKEANHRLR